VQTSARQSTTSPFTITTSSSQHQVESNCSNNSSIGNPYQTQISPHATHNVQQKQTTTFQERQITLAVHKLENQIAQAMAVLDKDTGDLLNYRQLLRHPKYKAQWKVSSANKFGRLAIGVGGRIKKPTKTIRFICEQDVPKDRRKDITYGSFTCSVRPEKTDEPNRTRFRAGGDKIKYPGEVATPTVEMLVAKLLFNSVVSTPDAKFITMDISNFYLMTPLL
jgi:hypothetical protein